MNLLTKAQILVHILHWRLTWDKHDSNYKCRVKNPKFITAAQAAEKIKDGAVVFSSGMAANSRCSIFFWAIRERFEKTKQPQNLTWIVVGAQGGRGKAPGTLEELAQPGLITRIIGGHLETVKAMLRLGDEKKVEIHVMPQGVETFLLEAQAQGKDHLVTETAVGTFLDPRVGAGTYVGGAPMSENFVAVQKGKLRFHFPKIDYALFVTSYADKEGNLYVRDMATLTEIYESAMAVKKNGGTVMASVSKIVPRREQDIFLSADCVDYIVVNPRSEQTGSVAQRRFWPMFTVDGNVDVKDAVARLKFANDILKITPVRTPMENAMARLAATIFTKAIGKGAFVNIGVGLPEEVCRLVYEAGLHQEVTFFTETGVIGGLPTPSIFFGAAINPKEMITSAQVFHRAYDDLDATVLGLLEADSQGNVNVSKRGERMADYVGPGGLPDLAAAAKNILFIGSWMAHSKIELVDGKVRIARPGPYKFIDQVNEITFSGQQALAKGKNVYYITNVGAFELTARGMCLIRVMPGIDIQKDILDPCPMKIVLPEDGNVPVVDKEIVTGEGFHLHID